MVFENNTIEILDGNKDFKWLQLRIKSICTSAVLLSLQLGNSAGNQQGHGGDLLLPGDPGVRGLPEEQEHNMVQDKFGNY